MNLDYMNFVSQTFSSISFFILVILLSGVIFVNGFSDAPNAIATCVSTRAISPRKALFMSGIFTFLGILIMSYINASVAHTIYNCFENLFDEYEELADCVEAVVVSNS